MEYLSTLLSYLKSFSISRLLPCIVLIVCGILVVKLVLKLVSKALEHSKLDPAAHKLVKTVVSIALYLILCLVVASRLGIDVSSIVALASVLTLAISLAVQDFVANIVGGFTILTMHPFHKDDYVEVAGQAGTVMEIGITYTKLLTVDNRTVSIPNSSVTSAQIVNYTVAGTRRVDIFVSASYDMAPAKVIEALKEAGAVPTALDTPAPFAGVNKYGESTIEYMLQVWTKSENYWTTLFDTNENIKKVFESKDVAMSYPHLNIHMDK